MKKSTKFLLFVYLFINFSVYAQTPKPTVIDAYYYCIGDSASQLTAGGANLLWYTILTGGTGSTLAPTPSTATAGSTPYYVTQTVGGIESLRKIITVNVDKQFNLVCGPNTISSVNFDFAHVGETSYAYSYVISGGGTSSGTLPGTAGNYTVNVLEGQSVTFTITAVGARSCVRNPTLSWTCTAECSPASSKTPDFPAIAPFCSGTAAPTLGPTSPNGITGTWSPATVSNTTSGSYVFTPNPTFPCAKKQTIPVTVTPLVTPNFTTIPSSVCQNATAPVLPLSSSIPTPISGTWSPSTVNTAMLGPTTYTFTPNPGQCVTAGPTTKTITVNQNITPTFTQVPAICSGAPLAPLPTTSNNGIIGVWSPALSNTVTKPYAFTPNPGQCATTASMTITVTPNGTPTFTAVPAICTGTPLAPLPTTSNNGYIGSWTPVLNNTATTTYTFTPNSGQCATTANLMITVNQLILPTFVNVPTAVCENDVPPLLPASSSNNPSITGIWNPATVNTAVIGTIDYVFTPNAGQCATTKTIPITVNPSNTLVNVNWTVTDAFSENQVVTITATGPGDYLYQLDDGPFQDSPVFEFVSLGTHSITVVDKNGCSAAITKTNVLVVNYPKYFTPNNDGSNDTWNIFSLEDQSNFRILIFDRYGKFLKEIRPKSLGWDGIYNGHPMPANDYWFSVEYAEQSIPKIFKSHFSLKR